MEGEKFEIVLKDVPALTVASVRWKGSYGDTGAAFKKLGRAAGRRISGPAMNLCHDAEYKEKDADVESCFPINGEVKAEGVQTRTLPGGKCVSLVHKGSYEELHDSYKKIFDHIKSKNLKPIVPSREIYIKGPGMIFKGNPKNYLTELQVFVE